MAKPGATTVNRTHGDSNIVLLEARQTSGWHRVDAVEIWHWHAGSPMALHVHMDGKTQVQILGPDIAADQRPQRIVPKDAWQKSIPQDGWVLVSCTVSPGFEFSGFELANDGWSPVRGDETGV